MNYDPEMPELPKRLSCRETAHWLGFQDEDTIHELIKVGLLKPVEDPPEATETL